MKTQVRTKKTFDAVAFMRKRREEISKEIEGMTPKQEIEYFKKNALKIKEQEVGPAHNTVYDVMVGFTVNQNSYLRS